MSGKYDKILRENIEPIIPFIIQKILGIDYEESRVIKDKLQVTVERETDYLCLILQSPQSYIMHLEFQSGGDVKMAARMLLYKAILYEKYELPVRQFVIYLGSSKKPRLPTSLVLDNLSFSYQVIRIKEIPIETFLTSDIPEGVIMAILGEFSSFSAKQIIQKILLRLQELAKEENRFQKYTAQLRILSQLRNLQAETLNQIHNMALKIDIRKDPLYEKGKMEGKAEGNAEGIAVGIAKKSRQIVVNLLRDTTFSDEKIAILAEVPIEFVRKIRKEMED
jgi:hypothetical protein